MPPRPGILKSCCGLAFASAGADHTCPRAIHATRPLFETSGAAPSPRRFGSPPAACTTHTDRRAPAGFDVGFAISPERFGPVPRTNTMAPASGVHTSEEISWPSSFLYAVTAFGAAYSGAIATPNIPNSRRVLNPSDASARGRRSQSCRKRRTDELIDREGLGRRSLRQRRRCQQQRAQPHAAAFATASETGPNTDAFD